MSIQHFAGLVLISVVNYRAVVTGKDKQRIIGNTQTVEGVHNLPNGPIQLENDIPTGTQPTLPGKARMGYTRHVHILCSHIQEEGFVGRRTNKVFSFCGNDIGYFLVFPQGRFSTSHPADTWNAVDDGIVMSLAGFQLHQFRIFFSRRPVTHLVVIAHGNRVRRVQSGHPSIFYKHTRHTIYRSRNNELVVKADALSVRFNQSVKVGSSCRSQPQMPFSHGACMIPRFVKYVSQGYASGVDYQF